MSQHDMVLDNQSRTNFRQDANSALQALATQQAGSGDPAIMYGYQTKIDISPLPASNAIVYIRKSDNSAWQRWAEIDKTTGRLLVDSSSVPAFMVNHNSNGTHKGFAVSGISIYTATIGITAYTDKQTFDLVFTNASTGPSTLNIDSVGAKKLYVEIGGVYTQVGSGDIFAGMHASVSYDSSLDSGIGGWVIRNKRDKLFVDHNIDGTHKQSAFSIHKNGVNQTGIVSGVWTKLAWPTKEWDTNNNFALDKFTPTIAGKYHLLACALLLFPVDQSYFMIAIFKNGYQYKTTKQWASGVTDVGALVSCEVDANGTTDYFEVYVLHGSGINKDVYGDYNTTYFQGYKIN